MSDKKQGGGIINLRGRKPVNGDIVPDSYVLGPDSIKQKLMIKRKNMFSFPTWKQFLFAPLPEHNPGVLSMILVGLQIFLFSYIAGLVIVLASDKVASDINAIPTVGPALPPPSLLSPAMGSLIIAFIQLAMLYGIGWMTREKNWPAYILPEKFWTMIITGKFGVVIAVICSGIGMLGYMVAGFTLRSLINGHSPNLGLLQPVTNVATGSLSYLFYWIGGSVINFAWLWCTQFKNDSSESHDSMYHRGLIVISVLTFAFVLAFYGPSPGHGLVVFSPGLYLTGLIYNDFPSRTFAGDTNTPWAIFIFVGLLLVPATASLLHIVFNWHVSYKIGGVTKEKTYDEEDYQETPSAPPSSQEQTQKSIGRNIVVNY